MACTCPTVFQRLFATMVPQLVASYEHAMKQAVFLVELETQRKPYTLNHYFNSNMQKIRGLKIKDQLEPHKDSHGDVSLQKIPTVMENKSNVEYMRAEIRNILRAYYKVASKRFVDYVYYQAVDHCPLSGPDSPLLLFSEKWVLDLDDKKLASIASENQQITDRRARLEKKVQDLKKAVEIL